MNFVLVLACLIFNGGSGRVQNNIESLKKSLLSQRRHVHARTDQNQGVWLEVLNSLTPQRWRLCEAIASLLLWSRLEAAFHPHVGNRIDMYAAQPTEMAHGVAGGMVAGLTVKDWVRNGRASIHLASRPVAEKKERSPKPDKGVSGGPWSRTGGGRPKSSRRSGVSQRHGGSAVERKQGKAKFTSKEIEQEIEHVLGVLGDVQRKSRKATSTLKKKKKIVAQNGQASTPKADLNNNMQQLLERNPQKNEIFYTTSSKRGSFVSTVTLAGLSYTSPPFFTSEPFVNKALAEQNAAKKALANMKVWRDAYTKEQRRVLVEEADNCEVFLDLRLEHMGRYLEIGSEYLPARTVSKLGLLLKETLNWNEYERETDEMQAKLRELNGEMVHIYAEARARRGLPEDDEEEGKEEDPGMPEISEHAEQQVIAKGAESEDAKHFVADLMETSSPKAVLNEFCLRQWKDMGPAVLNIQSEKTAGGYQAFVQLGKLGLRFHGEVCPRKKHAEQSAAARALADEQVAAMIVAKMKPAAKAKPVAVAEAAQDYWRRVYAQQQKRKDYQAAQKYWDRVRAQQQKRSTIEDKEDAEAEEEDYWSRVVAQEKQAAQNYWSRVRTQQQHTREKKAAQDYWSRVVAQQEFKRAESVKKKAAEES